MDQFMVERTIYDITDTVGLTANQTKEYDPNGQSGSTNYMTPGTVTSSSTNGAVAREVTSIEVLPPLNSSGQYEDLREIWLVLDNKSVQHYVNLPGLGWILMTPMRTQIIGGPHFKITFGEPLWKVIRDGGGNMPIRNTTLKFRRTLALAVSSVYGVTGAGSGGFRIIVKGYTYTPAQLALFAPHWNPHVRVQTFRRMVEGKPALEFDFPAPPLSLDTWAMYPGGVEQGAIKVNPKWQFAFNNNATSGSRAYAFTNLNALGGGSGNVEDTYQDMGYEFNLNNNALIVRGFGVRGVPLVPGQPGAPTHPELAANQGVNLQRAGWIINGDLVPEEEGGNNGIYVTSGVNPMAWGDVRPFLADTGKFFPVPKFPGELLIYKDNAVPFVAGNGSPIPQDNVVACVTGVLVEM
jgi:hypothetical protein